MQVRTIKTDEHLRELIEYKDLSFPIEICTDDYSTFLDHTMNCHWHNSFEFGTMVEGRLDFYTGETCLRMEKGDSVFVNANVLHMARQVDPGENTLMVGVVFPPSLFPGGGVFQKYFQPVLKMPLQGFCVKADSPVGRNMERTLVELCGLRDEEAGYELRCLSLISRLWLDTLEYLSGENHDFVMGETGRRHGDVVKQMISYIQEHYAEPVAIRDLTEHAHISRSECFRSFRRYTGKKPMEYINEYRLIQAADLLKETSLSVSEIGSACGFGSSSYFGKLFKEKYGVSPLGYRQGSACAVLPETGDV